VRSPAWLSRKIDRVAIAACLIVGTMVSACGEGSTTADATNAGTAAPTAQTPAINRVVDIGAYGLFLHCDGTGQLTVVFENGLGQAGTDWGAVRLKLGKKLRVCSYDRAGAGLSEPHPSGESSAAGAAGDLARLLTAAKEKPPYVLVGWSYGGMVARVYHDQHPDQVAGMVLVDSSSEHQSDDGEQLLDGATVVDWPATVKQTSRTAALGDLPLVVITADHHQGDSAKGFALWTSWQDELAALSSNSMHVIATQSDHPILFQQPDIVVQAINDVAASIDAQKPLEACGERYTSIAGECRSEV
jgi:pimeloyl-ACP methyl ester carboxylesterase